MLHMRTLAARPTPRPVPGDAKPKPAPTMTWAEMARAEGHRPKMPPSMEKKNKAPAGVATQEGAEDRRAEALKAIAEHGPIGSSICAQHIGVKPKRAATYVRRLKGAGLIAPACMSAGVYKYVITEEGKAWLKARK